MSAATASDSNAEWLSLDFETRSTIDLRKAGTYRYAEDPTTDVICAAFAFDDEPVQTWRPEQPLSNRFVDHVAGGGKVRGWNVNFERLIWREVATPRYGWPAPKLEQLWDTAAQGAALSLPRSLDGCGSALNLTIQKDKEGHALMMRLCRPRSYDEAGNPIWWTDEAKLARLTAYCRRDVEVERAIAKRLRPLSAAERVVYLLDARINDRGAALDLDLIASAQKIVARATTDLDRRMKAVTSGAVPKCTNVAKLVAWLIGRGVDLPTRKLTDKELEAAKEALRIAVLEGSVAVEDAEAEMRALAAGKPTLAKAAIRALLAEDDLEPVAREALALRAEAALSSTAKLTAMEKAACRDGRLRGSLMYHGTAPGRWSGRLAQPANLPRGTVPTPEMFIPAILAGQYEHVNVLAPPMAVVSSLLRGMFRAELKRKMIVVDWSQIQARIVPWVAGEAWKVQAFRDYDAGTGPDLYKLAAAKIYRCALADVSKPRRQVGKTSELACVFGGGVNAFQAMAAIFGLEIENDEADEIKNAWREANPAVADYDTGLWAQLERAAFDAVRRPGIVATAARGLIRFSVRGQWLYMILPSGRAIAYAYPSIKDTLRPWGDTLPSVCFWAVDSLTKQWTPHHTYGGKLCENVAMGIERDILVGAMIRLENAGYRIVLHNYDEIVCEVPHGFGSVDEVVALMTCGEVWCASGPAGALPIAAAGAELDRYAKLE